MANVELRWLMGVYGDATTATNTTYVLMHQESGASFVFTGAGFTYDGDGIPTGGTITSVVMRVNDGNIPMITLTNIDPSVDLGDFGTLLSEMLDLRVLITWRDLLGDLEVDILSSTQIRFINTDGTFTDLIGSGFNPHVPANLGGTVTSIHRIAADGVTPITNINGLNADLDVVAGALTEEAASDLLLVLLDTGSNTVTLNNNSVTVGSDTYSTVLISGPGNDTINGLPNGGTGLDYEFATSGVNANLTTGLATGGAGSDTFTNVSHLSGSYFSDTLTGNSESNWLTGRDGDDVLIGGGGNDTLEGRLDDDTLNGGSGVDTATYDEDDISGVTVSLAIAGAQDTGESGFDTLISIENLTGSSGSDALTGNSVANFLNGLGGADQLSGGGGDDLLNGGGSNDTLNGGTGNDILDGDADGDTMVGGAGDDTYKVDNVGDVTAESGGGGTDTVVSIITRSLSNNFENLTLVGSGNINASGNALDNTLIGNSGNNTLSGAAGADTMLGGAGADIYVVDNVGDVVAESANSGNDTIRTSVARSLAPHIENLMLLGSDKLNASGNAFNNVLTGNSGNNVLNGALGNDLLTGGAGADTFAFTTAYGVANRDRITDFNVADDTIRLENGVYTALSTGVLAAGALNFGAAATEADDRLIYNSTTGLLLYDSDGTGVASAQQIAFLPTALSLTNADFFVI